VPETSAVRGDDRDSDGDGRDGGFAGGLGVDNDDDGDDGDVA